MLLTSAMIIDAEAHTPAAGRHSTIPACNASSMQIPIYPLPDKGEAFVHSKYSLVTCSVFY